MIKILTKSKSQNLSKKSIKFQSTSIIVELNFLIFNIKVVFY